MHIDTNNNDDAGGGRRGLRAAPSPALFEALRDRYGIAVSENQIRDLGGSSSLNLLVTSQATRYVVRVYRPYVTAARLDDIQRVRGHLAGNGVPCSKVVPTRDGQPWIALDNRLVEVEPYIEHDGYMDSWERLQAGIPLLGRMHTLLRRVEASADGRLPRFANHIEPRDTLDRTLRGTRRIRGWKNPSPEELRLADAAEDLARRVCALERDNVALLPRQLAHGDFWHNNVFFRENDVALVTDFDFMGERARIDDLALTLYYATATFSEGRFSEDRMRRLRGVVDAYDENLNDPLSSDERAALPLAIARQPLWSIGGWVALLDDETRARQHARGLYRDIEGALRLVHDRGIWQRAFA